MTAPKYPERLEKSVSSWDKEDKDGKETEHTRGAKLVTGDARITRMANKTGHICEERRRLVATSESLAKIGGCIMRWFSFIFPFYCVAPGDTCV